MEQMEQFVSPFVEVTSNTFKTFVGCDITPRNPFFNDPEADLKSDTGALSVDNIKILGIIGLSGVVRGSVIIAIKEPVALKITGMLTGNTHTTVDVDVVDAIGEIVNIIAGCAKQKIPDGERMVISLPTVVRGMSHSIAGLSKQKILCIPFKIFEDDVFHLEVAIVPEKSA